MDSGVEIRLAAVDVLTDVLQWRLAEPRWARVAGIVESLEVALSRGDLPQLESAVIDLELAGPVRITPVGAVPQVPPPRAIRERINRMVHSLAEPAPQQDSGEREPSRDHR